MKAKSGDFVLPGDFLGVSEEFVYWGAPIPMIYCDKCGVQPVPVEQLPLILPDSHQNRMDFYTSDMPEQSSQTLKVQVHMVDIPICVMMTPIPKKKTIFMSKPS